MSSNLIKYKKAFIDTFSVEEKDLDKLEYQSIENWDSIGHMTLMSSIEEAFEMTFETDDIIEFSSFSKGKEILEKYKIKI
jgi:acyl carrier protein|tara:strand:- start:2634 stop:2873 length:240 start_codon:yes stop_codon:yes gene_type:complete